MTGADLPLRSDVPQPIRDPSGCLLWQGRVDENGYAKLGRGWAHRTLWERLVGPIPVGYEINHRCRTPLCVDVEHLECITTAEHYALRLRERCGRGHDPDWYIRRDNGSRQCRACRRERERSRCA